jgi:carbon-monoxide dehydrogenase medium subunit
MLQFDYVVPGTLDGALDILAQFGPRVRILAGGTDLLPELRSADKALELVADIGKLVELGHIRCEDGIVRIGSLVTIKQILRSELLRQKAGSLIQTASKFGNPLIRNRATIGGNLASASPAADMAVPLLALDAKVCLQSKHEGSREVLISDFFKAPGKTVMRSNELISVIEFPETYGAIPTVYFKLGRRRSAAVPIISVAVAAKIEREICQSVHIALGSVAPTPIRAFKAERVLKGKKVTESLLRQSLTAVIDEINPVDDIRASARYRSMMAKVLVKRGLTYILTH